jgi:hypothetical protein
VTQGASIYLMYHYLNTIFKNIFSRLMYSRFLLRGYYFAVFVSRFLLRGYYFAVFVSRFLLRGYCLRGYCIRDYHRLRYLLICISKPRHFHMESFLFVYYYLQELEIRADTRILSFQLWYLNWNHPIFYNSRPIID